MGHMPNLKQVIDVLETLYPLRYAEEWDEPGPVSYTHLTLPTICSV